MGIFKKEAEDAKMNGISNGDKRKMMNEIWKELDIVNVYSSIYDLAVDQKVSILAIGESGMHLYLYNSAI